ncbi:CAMK family protein kinase [Trichomonas vaginalis G3]|uniref:CAMK family protein kinase n=1 Tax=Trichomonas vaginalis (strain ATCC PRA-98 / G3) TaxID=412133 RepID=A2E535_TRIV3|nr:protein serine/threonine kinase protein [Trichomonas vaginalis G3]EAY12243.1 CAMK family protein kinase [Trichomonas vaginalis G3]KAI5536028.1 protein serine/threonine kinase protein [Trichomonas vaginalis G3]|eukprot:XP_001324466.1 CAMK family protein kinase [Trichomonas vaginalis G3]
MKDSRLGVYLIQNEIGRGATSRVHTAINTITNKKLCVKILEKSSLETAEDFEFFRREVAIISSLAHKNIVRYHDLMEDECYYYLFQEFCPGVTLTKFLEKNNLLSDRLLQLIFRQIFSALAYMHKLHVGHRDLKPDNILIDQECNIKIVDFGLSTDDNTKLRTTFCGSLAFAPPECIKREPYNAAQADIWSLGVMLYMAATGKLPWRTTNLVQIMKQITSGNFSIPCNVSNNVRNIIMMCMNQNPSQRPTADELLTYPIVPLNGVQRPQHGTSHSPRNKQLVIARTASNPSFSINNSSSSCPVKPPTPETPRSSHRRIRPRSNSIGDLATCVPNTPSSSILTFI